MSIEVEDIEGMQSKPDFRRANGAPMIVDKEGKNQRYSRPSGWGKVLDDENALVNWKIDTAAVGVARDASLQAEWSAVKDDDKEKKGKLREKAIQAGRGNQAADTGTALHAMSERWEDPEDDFQPPPKYRVCLEAYSAEMARIGIVSEMMEYHSVNEEYRAAGTVDRLYRLTKDLITPDGTVLPAGTLVTGDLKTGKKLDFSLPGYHVQMAIYAQGEFYNVETDTFMPTPEINRDWGILVWMPASGPDEGTCKMLWCDLEVGNYGAYLVHEVRDWRRKWRGGIYASPEVQVASAAEASNDKDEQRNGGKNEHDGQEVHDGTVPEFVELMRPFLKLRIAALREHTEASHDVQMNWPSGVPGPNKIETDAQMTKALDVIDKIETKYGLPFLGGDPRGQTSGHSSSYSITNKAPGVVQKEVTK